MKLDRQYTVRQCKFVARTVPLWLALATGCGWADQPATPATPGAGSVSAIDATPERLEVPDVQLLDQKGRRVRLYSDLVKGKVVAINFIFTSCPTICPPMGLNFGKLRKVLGERVGRDFELISISLDPVTDTPARLDAWSQRYGAGPGWTLLTGEPRAVERVLKSLGGFSPDKASHSPLALLGNEATGEWKRAYGLAPPSQLAELMVKLRDPPGRTPPSGATPEPDPSERNPLAPKKAATAEPVSPPVPVGESAAHRYFGDVALVSQNGEKMRLYTDLLQGRVVVINTFFTSCQGSCPVMATTMAKIQDWLGERLGKDAYLISISVDPETDTPEQLLAFAQRYHAKPGWYFLTGSSTNIKQALGRLGMDVAAREQHSNIMILGNEVTGLWKKAFGLAGPEEIIKLVDGVLKDKPAGTP